MPDGVAIAIDDRELQQMTRALQLDLQRMSQPEQLLTDLGVELEGQTKARFDAKADPEGSAWEPWSEDYKAQQLVRHPGASLLERSSRLREDVTHEVAPTELLIGARTVYAAVHQFGYEEIPARPYLGLSLDDRRDIGELIDDFIRGSFEVLL